ncbi:helix-turn-helix transcriptional regulator [Burkholderiaceae bacterium DAT-1]|nr:helix-turn-helix transcriptional regulator [Burkholderiaceae bacterium DAT-1]
MINTHHSNAAVAQEMGARLRQARLNANLTQADVARMAGISRTGVTGAERGKALLETMIAIMRVLNLLDQLDRFLPPQPVSPVQLAKLQGKTRQRARRASTVPPDAPSSGDETW